MKVIVAGSRGVIGTKENIEFLKHSLRKLGATEVVSGCAKGADQLGELVARSMGLPVRQFPANWNKEGKAAGYIRNEQMAEYGDALVYIQIADSRGTSHMVALAGKYGLEVIGKTE